jgi:hypothetical protein
VEALWAFIAKGLWGALAFTATVLFGWTFKRLNDTYTKDEVDGLITKESEKISLVLKSNEKVSEKLNVSIEKLTEIMTELHSDMKLVKYRLDNEKDK